MIITIACFVLGVQNNLNSWHNKTVIGWDVRWYYSYLPAQFVKHDLSLSFIKSKNDPDYYVYAPNQTADRKWVVKTTMGMAIMYAPFFLTAHMLASPFGYVADGYSDIYQLFLLLGGLFYLIVGLCYLRKSLLLFHSERITALTLLIIYFATNLVCYSTIESPMSHQYGFCLFSVLIYGTIQWLRKPGLKYILCMGLASGLLILIRPVNIVFLLFPLLYGAWSLKGLGQRMALITVQWKHTLLYLALVMLVLAPQLIYWKMATGHYIYYSYTGEYFYFSHPHLTDCLLGFRKGWLIYTPACVFALCGFYHLYIRRAPFFYSSLVVSLLYFYVISSWWCWWYGGSFGLRAMIDLYPLLSFGLAAFLSAVTFRKTVLSKAVGAVLCFCTALNLFQTVQYHYNIIHYDSMTVKAYLNAFGKTSKTDCDRSLLQAPDYEKAVKGE